MTCPEKIAIRQHLSKPAPVFSACGCMGPRDGEPFCPCAMQNCEQVDGKWYEIVTHRSPEGITHSAHEILVKKVPQISATLSVFPEQIRPQIKKLKSNLQALSTIQKFEAIKLLRSVKEIGTVEAKNAVEAYFAELDEE